jgi:putative transposase
MEQRRTIVEAVRPTAGSERPACHWLGFHRSAVRYEPNRRDDEALRTRLRDLADLHPRWGALMLLWKLRQEGITDNYKRVRRLYRLEGLAVYRRGRKHVPIARVELPSATRPNEHWAMDFVRDTLNEGRAFRALTRIDAYACECPVIEVDVSLDGTRVVAVLERLRVTRGLPERITVDNRLEFRSKALDALAHQHGLQFQFSRPGKPVDNTFIEAFNGQVRDECLNQHWFLSLADARRTIEQWHVGYNTARPHRALAGQTPPGFAASVPTLVTFTRLSAYNRTSTGATSRAEASDSACLRQVDNPSDDKPHG